MGLKEDCVLRGSFACCDCSFKADSKTTDVRWRRLYSKCSSRAVMHFVRGLFSVVYFTAEQVLSSINIFPSGTSGGPFGLVANILKELVSDIQHIWWAKRHSY
jgi:hypothetical protein